MKRDAVDLSRVPERHTEVNQRLEDWARWVRSSNNPYPTQPMFRQYRSHAWQWHMPEIVVALNTLECLETEREVAKLPAKHRDAVRWAYVWYFVPVNVVRRELAVTRDGLQSLIQDGRDMLKNRMKSCTQSAKV
jgi:hypothetical protein